MRRRMKTKSMKRSSVPFKKAAMTPRKAARKMKRYRQTSLKVWVNTRVKIKVFHFDECELELRQPVSTRR